MAGMSTVASVFSLLYTVVGYPPSLQMFLRVDHAMLDESNALIPLQCYFYTLRVAQPVQLPRFSHAHTEAKGYVVAPRHDRRGKQGQHTSTWSKGSGHLDCFEYRIPRLSTVRLPHFTISFAHIVALHPSRSRSQLSPTPIALARETWCTLAASHSRRPAALSLAAAVPCSDPRFGHDQRSGSHRTLATSTHSKFSLASRPRSAP
jgi:hypothetical protein